MNNFALTSISLVALLAFGALACSSDSNGGGGNTGGTSGSSGSGGSSGGGAGGAATGGSGPKCEVGPGFAGNDKPQTINSVSAKVQDLAGNPATGALATLCGTDVCYFGKVDSKGDVVSCDKNNICAGGIVSQTPIIKPAFKYGGGYNHAKFALPIPAGDPAPDIGVQLTAKFPPQGSGSPLVAGETVTSSGVSLTLASPAKIKFEPDYTTADEKKFRAVEIPMAKAPKAVDASLNFEVLVATTPVDTHICPHAKLSVPNTAGWAAGTAVEFYMHGVSVVEEWAPYGGWAKISEGKVDADGKTISTNDGEGVPLLTVFGVRKKP